MDSPKALGTSLANHFCRRTGCCTQPDDGCIQAGDPVAMLSMVGFANRHNAAQPRSSFGRFRCQIPFNAAKGIAVEDGAGEKLFWADTRKGHHKAQSIVKRNEKKRPIG